MIQIRLLFYFFYIVLLRISGSNTILWGVLFVSLHCAGSSSWKDCYGCVAG